MAATFEIKGAGIIKLSGTIVGQTSADDLPEWEENIHERPIFVSEGGPEMPAKIINLGRTAMIRANLIKYDDQQLATLRRAGATEGQIGVLGSDRDLQSVSIEGNVSGSKTYTFPKCRVESVRDRRWGLEENVIELVIRAIPDPTALTTSTTELYTIGSVA